MSMSEPPMRVPGGLRPNAPLPRSALAELLGTALLAATVVGSGITAERLSPGEPGLQLLENSAATALGLTVAILVFAPLSGAHFNPLITMADFALGRRSGAGADARTLAVFLPVQVAGAVAGVVLANLMFALPPVTLSAHARSSGHLRLGEGVAAAGLILVLFTMARTGRGRHGPATIGAYTGAVFWFASSSFANPAVTLARTLTDTFAGIAPASVPGFAAAQLAGAAVGTGLVAALYPDRHAGRAPVPAPRADGIADGAAAGEPLRAGQA